MFSKKRSFNLELRKFTDKESFCKWIDDLNKVTAKLYDDAYKHYYSLCENEMQKQIFTDWWNGECVSTEEYKKKNSPDDNYQAGGIILTAISNGFG